MARQLPPRRPPRPRGSGDLTTRQLEVLAWTCGGHSGKEVAAGLGIKHGTIKNHLTAVYYRLDVPSQAAACEWFGRHRETAHRHDDDHRDDVSPAPDGPGMRADQT